MITSFTPCVNYVTGSSSNGTSPTASCCNALKSLMSTSMDCACLVITANVPVQIPLLNPSLALSLPRACKMGGVPLQCQASGSPLPAPGPAVLGSPLPPAPTSPLTPQASKAVAAAPAPRSEVTLPLAPASLPPVAVEAPRAAGRIRPVVSPSASTQSYVAPASWLLMFMAMVVFKCY
ncbi:hypothetical protein Tsubulata_039385 [Turnera subulata]|uniref:Bifunctional inhibitor/plant lipid transfer protein/seed storage helical domain-containing protein n=1 Tax=Turnera subulata TaxID=218843 RepID=A0A9Q0JLS4_9ROSI|nr:hypothetical protein Tsubulata_039385 [Turnera subulata]